MATERENISRGVHRGARRFRKGLGNLIQRLFRLDIVVRESLRRRLLDKKIEESYKDLGEFIYSHGQQQEVEEGDLVLMDLMRGEIVRLSEERTGPGFHELNKRNPGEKKSERG